MNPPTVKSAATAIVGARQDNATQMPMTLITAGPNHSAVRGNEFEDTQSTAMVAALATSAIGKAPSAAIAASRRCCPANKAKAISGRMKLSDVSGCNTPA